MAELLLGSLWLAAPLILCGAVHIAIIRARLFQPLAEIPLDFGRTFRGRRIFGKNKTLRGALVTIAGALGFTLIQAALFDRFQWVRNISLVDFATIPPVAWGLLLGIGYVIGELPNSFLKRQLDIAPGEPARGPAGVVFWVADQVDSLVGILVCVALFWRLSLPAVVALLAVTLLVHPAMAGVMYIAGLKKRVG